jgi:hypothetical protein
VRRIAILGVTVLALLAGCGKRPVLRPADGKMMPPKAQSAAAQPGVGDLLTPPVQARPNRDDELVTKSRPLQPDRFDLPPPG